MYWTKIWSLFFGFLCVIAARDGRGASAVAVGVRPDGREQYGYSFDWKTTEHVVKNKAIGQCMAGGGLSPKIIASTGRLGWGMIVMYSQPGQRDRVVAVVGAASEEQAINEAMKKAKAAGGRTAKVVRGWHDLKLTTRNL
jgi:hypothetical protein